MPLPRTLAQGRHTLTVTLKDIHSTVVAQTNRTFTIQTSPLIGASAAGADGGSGTGAADSDDTCEDGGRQGVDEWVRASHLECVLIQNVFSYNNILV